MTSKTDKRSSLDHVMHYIDRKAEFGKTIPVANAKRAAQYAFNAGRESVVENMPKLMWNDFSDGLENYYASCPIGWCYKVSYKVNEFSLFCNDCFLGRFLSLEQAKHAANEDYKKRIKQALGL